MKINPLVLALGIAGAYYFMKGKDDGSKADGSKAGTECDPLDSSTIPEGYVCDEIEPGKWVLAQKGTEKCDRGWVNGYCLFITEENGKYGYKIITRKGEIVAAQATYNGYDSQDEALLAGTEKRDTLPNLNEQG